jgi:probable phosphoglycerate mutase
VAVPGQPFPLEGGHSNPPLSPQGEAQAERIGERLRHEPIARIFVSTLVRTHQTAAPTAAALGLEPEVIADLREIGLGDWEGGEYRIRAAKGDPIVKAVHEQERWDLLPNGESFDTFTPRTRGAIEHVVAQTGPDALAAVFAHGAVIGELCRQATASRPFAFVHSDNASISRLVVLADGRWLLRSFNDISHLV